MEFPLNIPRGIELSRRTGGNRVIGNANDTRGRVPPGSRRIFRGVPSLIREGSKEKAAKSNRLAGIKTRASVPASGSQMRKHADINKLWKTKKEEDPRNKNRNFSLAKLEGTV